MCTADLLLLYFSSKAPLFCFSQTLSFTPSPHISHTHLHTPPSNPQGVYVLPDQQKVRLTDERFKAPEVLFNPTRMDSEEKGWHRLVWSSIQSCGIDSRAEMMANVILSGGNTLFKGIGRRLQSEVTDLKGPSSAIVKVVEDPARAELVFSGASVCDSMRLFFFLK